MHVREALRRPHVAIERAHGGPWFAASSPRDVQRQTAHIPETQTRCQFGDSRRKPRCLKLPPILAGKSK